MKIDAARMSLAAVNQLRSSKPLGADYCQGSRQHAEGSARKFASLPQGEVPGASRGKIRCPTCNRRLQLKARFSAEGEFIDWVVPDHKARETKKPSPRRKQKSSGRRR